MAASDAAAHDARLAQADDEQRTMMEERVIITDYYDTPIDSGSKKDSALLLSCVVRGFFFSPRLRAVPSPRQSMT